MNQTANPTRRLTLRIGHNSLMILAQDEGDALTFEPFVVKSGISMAANLREAFKQSDLLLTAPPRVRVLLDNEVLMVPVELFSEQTMETMFRHAYPSREQEAVCFNVLPDLNAVAVFSVNKDLRLVLDDHFRDVRLLTVMQPVWRYMHQRSFTGMRQKLYAYFHEKRLELFAFQQHRFRFCNSYETARVKDAVFFITYVWNQLAMSQDNDELYLMGDIPEEEETLNMLHRFLKKVMVVNPAADFGQHPATAIKGMPYDLQTLLAKGR
ncbi:MAG: DUF3822 family protein [Prevotella sp.]|nr:DUF3822 family protein [Prevotella sp.]